jgi:hypothetical protein
MTPLEQEIQRILNGYRAAVKANNFLGQVQAEKDLADAIRASGLTPTMPPATQTTQEVQSSTQSSQIDVSDRAGRQLGIVSVSVDLPLREDLTFKVFTNTFAGAGNYTVVAGVADQKIKVYAYDYEIDAAFICYFMPSVGSGGFGIRKTAGVLSQTFNMPFVGQAGLGLLFHADGILTVAGFIAFVQEA